MKPRNVSKESVVGQISLDWILTDLLPQFEDLASNRMQDYASALMIHCKGEPLEKCEAREVEVSADGSTTQNQDRPKAPFFDKESRIAEFTTLLRHTSNPFFAKVGGWRSQAGAAKFERSLDETYGVFRPFVDSHPEVEDFLRHMQRQYTNGAFRLTRQGEPPIGKTSSVVLLFMIHRSGAPWQVTVLGVLFLLVGLQPWALVALLVLAKTVLSRRLGTPLSPMKKRIPLTRPYYQDRQQQDDNVSNEQKLEHLLRPVGSALIENEQLSTAEYDVILLGSGVDSLFAASLLSRSGRRVLVLSHDNDASGCETISKVSNVPFDMRSHNLTKISKQQRLLAPALCSIKDCQGGIRFANIGSDADGYASEIFSIPGVGADRMDQSIPFVLRAGGGLQSLMEDVASLLGDSWPGADGNVGKSATGAFVKACEKINASGGDFYLRRVMRENSFLNKPSNTAYQNASVQPADKFLNSGFPMNPHLRSLLAAIGLKGENVSPGRASLAMLVTNVCGTLSGEGLHYPIGGPRALCHALATVVEQSGGRIITGVKFQHLVFAGEDGTPINTQSTSSKSPRPTCLGVQLNNGVDIAFDYDRAMQRRIPPVVVSMLPFTETFIRLVPSSIRDSFGFPPGLGGLSEERPVFVVLVLLDGSATDLSITGADYYRVPGASRAIDEVDPTSGETKCGATGWMCEDANGIDREDRDPGSKDSKKKGKPIKFQPGLSWMHISFPSAKDPSFNSRHEGISTCTITIEADDSFVTDMGTKPKLFSTKTVSARFIDEAKQLQTSVIKDLLEVYPQLEGMYETRLGTLTDSSWKSGLTCGLLSRDRKNPQLQVSWSTLSWSLPYA